MSEAVPFFGVVAEGKTDYYILKSVVAELSGLDPVIKMIQPELSRTFQELGEGWKGVRNWCLQCKDVYGGLSSRSFAALIIHVDADIASDAEINCEKPCPPASDTVDALREVVLGWVGDQRLPERIVLCIPPNASKCGSS